VIRVVLAEDHELVREGLRAILDLEIDIDVVGEAATGRGAIDAVAQHRPDVLVLDIQMPELNGIEVLQRLASQPDQGTAVLVLTTFDADEYVYNALRAGAAGFLLKDVPRAQLLHAIRTIAAGSELLAPTVTRRLIERFLRSPESTGLIDRLSEREREVLALVGQGLSNSEIAGKLFLGEATVKTHVGSIFAKCGLRDRSQAVIIAYESGLVRPGD